MANDSEDAALAAQTKSENRSEKMPDMATIITSVSTLVVAVGALVVSVGVFYLVVRLGRAIELMSSDRKDD